MTPAQARVYELILKLSKRLKITPSCEEIAKNLGLRSVATVHKHLHALIRDGHLKTLPGGSRNLICVGTPSIGLAHEARDLRIELAMARNRPAKLQTDPGR